MINLKITTAQMNKYANIQRMPTLKELSQTLKEDEEIEYVTEKSEIASKKYEVGENPSSIYTKLNKYPYEFEINSSLQLANINGVKNVSNSKIEDIQNKMSASEHFTGSYYFNGKPIYSKTIYVESIPGNTTSKYAHEIDDADIIWIDTSKSFLLCNKTTMETETVPAVNDSSVQWNLGIHVDRNCIIMYCRYVNRNFESGYVTLNYTKETDTGDGTEIPNATRIN